MGFLIVFVIAFIFATGAVTIWDVSERAVQKVIERVKARIMLKNSCMLEYQAMQRQRIADSEWRERKMWHEEIDRIHRERGRKLLNEKF